MKNIRILTGLVLFITLISAIVLLSSRVQQPRNQGQTTTPTTTQKSGIAKEISEINSLVDGLDHLSRSVNELNENEDLLPIFAGD